MSKKIVYRSCSNNPYFNIAFEHWLFNHYEGEDILYLWCNQPSVIIGRFQNPWTECCLSEMKSKGVHLVRRESGGGAVFHDLGNGIFSFYSPLPSLNEEIFESRNYERLIKSLSTFGIISHQSSRNDLTITVNGETRKVSGNAFKKKGGVNLQHGTMLINSRLEELSNYLTPNLKKLSSKGITSVRSRVVNLNELNPSITVKKFHDALEDVFWEEDPSKFRETIWIDESLLEKVSELKAEFNNLQNPEWILGKTPQFNQNFRETFDFGSWEVYLEVENLIIREIYIFTDCLSVDFTTQLIRELRGISYTSEGIEKTFANFEKTLDTSQKRWAKSLADWFIRNIS